MKYRVITFGFMTQIFLHRWGEIKVGNAEKINAVVQRGKGLCNCVWMLIQNRYVVVRKNNMLLRI